MSMHSRFTTLALALAAAGTIQAQETTGTLVGTITNNKNGTAVRGAIVVIRSPKLMGERRAVTDETGGYRIPLLPNGDYTMSVSAARFASGTVKFRIVAGLTFRQDARIAPEETGSEVVEVVAQSGQVDKTETTTQTVYTQETINSLFSQGLMHAVDLAPGVVNDGNAVVRGGNRSSAKWLVNGLIANETGWGYSQADLTVINDMVESFNIIQSPMNARYGNTDSGVISVVTTRGSNEFKGSLRVQYDKSWSLYRSVEGEQPNRLGESFSSIDPRDDAPSRNYQVTISGPIIKDRVTFAYGGKFTPATRSTGILPRRFSDVPNYKDNAGIWFRDPASGAQIHRAELYDAGKTVGTKNAETFNQYVLYVQLTPEHSLEYNYSEWGNDWTWIFGPHASSLGVQDDHERSRYWNAAYKGIIGSSGLLEVRAGKITRSWQHPFTYPQNPGIYESYYPTLMADPATGKPYVTGPVDALTRGRWSQQITEGAGTDRGDAIMNTSFLANYQQLVSWHGEHQIDLGLEYQKHEWDTQAGGTPLYFVVPGGRIATDLRASDIIGGTLNPASYAGKYIMWGPRTPLGQIDPGYMAANPQLDPATNPYSASKYYGLIPRMRVKMGQESGLYGQPTTSYWINDLWTINPNHSVMMGLRADRWALTQNGTIAAYTEFSPRFEYKWDPAGDQKRLISFSAAKFHNRQPGGLFQSFIQKRLGYTLYYRYTGPNNVHLVDKAYVTDPNNYKDLYRADTPGGTKLDPSWRNDHSIELAATFRRSYANGGFWRATLVSRTWKNQFEWFPEYKGTQITNPFAPTMPPLTTYLRVLKPDNEAKHTYNSLELEWNAPITARLTVGGNYTYARNMRTQQLSGIGLSVTDDPGGNSGAYSAPQGNFRDYLRTIVPQDQWRQEVPMGDEHILKGWFVWDLTVGKVKSSLGMTATYWTGSPYSRSTSYYIGNPPSNLMPGYTDKGYNTGIPQYINTYAGPAGGFTSSDWVDMGLKYNIELPVARGFRWWAGIEIKQPFNHIFRSDAGVGGFGDDSDPVHGPATLTAHGWRASSDVSGAGIQGRYGQRSIWIESGFRF